MGYLDYVLFNEIRIICDSLALDASKCEGLIKETA